MFCGPGKLLDDVLGDGPVGATPSAPDPDFVGEVVDPDTRRLAAGRQVSPVSAKASHRHHPVARRAVTSCGPPRHPHSLKRSA
ncbi:hypothetical protein ACFVTY_09410 [Streptomyces sp. NPDC058067]|uniref:hypothetical protein n=1 Tax=Streptomyces sp. NPDC058067 TaxID=3346324 RepID=UPI0036E63777